MATSEKDTFLDGLSELAASMPVTDGPIEPKPGPTAKDLLDLGFNAMLDLISPEQHKEEDPDYVPLNEHLGFFEPEIKDDNTYNQLVQAVKDAGHWSYSGPNRIEPVQEGYIDTVQLQTVLNQFEYGPDDFFRGSITLWGIYEHGTTNHLHPNYLEVICIEKIEGQFRVVNHVLKDGTTQ